MPAVNGSVGMILRATLPAGAGTVVESSTVPPVRRQLSWNAVRAEAANLHGRIAPRFTTLGRNALPGVADAQPPDKRDIVVDNQELAMITSHPSEERGDCWWVEDPDLAAGLRQRAKQTLQRAKTATEPVVDDADVDPVTSASGQQVDEPAPGAIVVDDVHLQVDACVRCPNCLFPRGVVLSRVTQDPHGIARHQWGTCRSAEGLIGQTAQRD
jgi:hypothetical protein